MTRARRPLSRSVFLASFLLLWALAAREPPWSDAATVRSVARAIAIEGRLDLPHASPGYTLDGPDGRHYGKYPLAMSLVEAPAQWPERWVETAAMPMADKELYSRVLRGVTPAVVGATAIALTVALLLALGHATRVAVGVAATFGLATCALPYLRSHWSEALQACAVGLALLAAVRFRDRSTVGRAAALGLSLGLLPFVKPVLAVFAAAVGAGALAATWPAVRRRPSLPAWAAVAALPPLAANVMYDLLRAGVVVNTYHGFYLVPQDFSHDVLDGLYGLLLSPGRGLVWYAPVAVLSASGAIALIRRRPSDPIGQATVAGTAATVLVYSAFTVWHGAEQWGPRFLVPLMPALAVLGAPVASRMATGRLPARLALAGLAAAGLFVNVPGMLISPTQFFAVVPHRPHSEVHLDRDMRPTSPVEADNLALVNHVPAYSPIAGHRWLLWHALAGGDPAKDAPWLEQSAGRPALRQDVDPRVDLWFLPEADWPDDTRAVAFGLLGLMLLATAGATVEVLCGLTRTAASAPPAPPE